MERSPLGCRNAGIAYDMLQQTASALSADEVRTVLRQKGFLTYGRIQEEDLPKPAGVPAGSGLHFQEPQTDPSHFREQVAFARVP